MSDPTAAAAPMFRRVVLKLSGETLAGERGYGIDTGGVREIAAELISVRALGVDVALVVGGGNIWRGRTGSESGMDRAAADYMGMPERVLTALALQDVLKGQRVENRCEHA